MSRGLLGQRSPIHMRYNRKDTLKEADLIILAGAVCDFRLSYGRVLSPNANVVSINRDRTQMLKNEGIFWRVNLAVQADVATTLVNLADYLNSTNHEVQLLFFFTFYLNIDLLNSWFVDTRMGIISDEERKRKNTENLLKMKEAFVKDGINPLFALSLINKVLPENAILIADGGDFIGSASYIVHPRGPLQWLDPVLNWHVSWIARAAKSYSYALQQKGYPQRSRLNYSCGCFILIF
ncbi:hypothetical protein WUBG_16425 [Wuchereria bancrofti]|uniref:Thiamine pyrophosphate enzyme central domain-containing protein n=1 Tax=Wuchereria bancrofti TaxID=6293 RepID=J9DST0_WUCBA|nr:hypothetical protein WUBG_16425 [Wuchereria bancrofti]